MLVWLAIKSLTFDNKMSKHNKTSLLFLKSSQEYYTQFILSIQDWTDPDPYPASALPWDPIRSRFSSSLRTRIKVLIFRKFSQCIEKITLKNFSKTSVADRGCRKIIQTEKKQDEILVCKKSEKKRNTKCFQVELFCQWPCLRFRSVNVPKI